MQFIFNHVANTIQNGLFNIEELENFEKENYQVGDNDSSDDNDDNHSSDDNNDMDHYI